MAYTAIRVINWANGEAIWLVKKKSCYDKSLTDGDTDCIPLAFKDDFVDQIRPTIKIICMILIVLAIGIDLLSFKYRHLTDMLVIPEWCLFRIVITLIPSEMTTGSELSIYLYNFVAFIWFFTDSGIQVVIFACSVLA